ncbi:MAG: hypothetical protein CVT88_06705 [Candidatus Altiarchaeales archaeon HGW-Altiarchaeales-1]|nr:MAG: hypothetical protein CVT88_06705 [Candidatus Altiarchaeales archaeon HGW-Altiarchaeales-1]
MAISGNKCHLPRDYNLTSFGYLLISFVKCDQHRKVIIKIFSDRRSECIINSKMLSEMEFRISGKQLAKDNDKI